MLLVDDDAIINMVNKRMVVKYDLADDPVVCEDGKQALDYLEQNQHKFDNFIVLLDINMPVLNGWQFLEEVEHKKWKHKLMIFMLSSSVADEDVRKSQDYDLVNGYVSKPLNADKCERIKNHDAVDQLIDL